MDMSISLRKETAEAFSTRKHEGQKRKYTGDPYIIHPLAVRDIVASVPHTPEMLDAAVLHDTVEDTNTELYEILERFGPLVMDYVSDLTDISLPSDGNRAQRKAVDCLHLSHASPAAKTIKLADLIHNTQSIVQHDPEFARIYLQEKRLLLQVLVEGDPTLHARATALLEESLALLDLDSV